MILRQPDIRDHLNRFMELGREYHLQEIYDYFLAINHTALKHNIRATLQTAKRKGQVKNIARSGWHTRIDYIQ